MPHNAGRYIHSHIAAATGPVVARPITHLEALSLSAILKDDAKDYFYSAAASIAAAYNSINERHYSWATVQLYYSCFYTLRGLLGISGICLFYIGHTPYILKAKPGETITKHKGTTHAVVLETAKRELNTAINFSQTIDAQDPLDWFKDLREDVNYRNSRFPEPTVPDCLKMCERHGVRRLLNDYLNDKSLLYAFDADHAIVAYSLLIWTLLHRELKTAAIFDYAPADLSFLKSIFTDDAGSLSPIHKFLE